MCLSEDRARGQSQLQRWQGVTSAKGVGYHEHNGFVDDDVTLLGVFYDPSAAPLVSSGEASGEGVAAVPEPETLLLATAMSGLLVAIYGRRESIR